MAHWTWIEHMLVRAIYVKKNEIDMGWFRAFVIDQKGEFHNSAYEFVELLTQDDEALRKSHMQDIPNNPNEEYVRFPEHALTIDLTVHIPSQLESEFDGEAIKRDVYELIKTHFNWKEEELKTLSFPHSFVLQFNCWGDEYDGEYDSGVEDPTVLWKSLDCIYINEYGSWTQ